MGSMMVGGSIASQTAIAAKLRFFHSEQTSSPGGRAPIWKQHLPFKDTEPQACFLDGVGGRVRKNPMLGIIHTLPIYKMGSCAFPVSDI